MPDAAYESWGRYPKLQHIGSIAPKDVNDAITFMGIIDSSVLPRGLGRSYGDSCLNENGYLISTKYMNRFLSFDANTGIVRCESGVTLDEILRVFVPQGWFLPVTPGTKFVTIGGAIANDVHGKNHHRAGNFGNHVIRFELLRSGGERILCSENSNADWFHATIGGLGLTGLILWADIILKPINGPYIEMESIRFANLEDFFHISRESSNDYEYTVAWIDSLATGRSFGRGIFMRGNHSGKKESDQSRVLHKNPRWKTFPLDAPSFVLSEKTVKLFNYMYYHKQIKKHCFKLLHYDAFFYPLDSINNWNRMYGRRGFLQWQCVVPNDEAIKKILGKITQSKLASFLVVLKEFGDIQSGGMLSFPQPGVTLALDFPNSGKPLFNLLDRLDRIVVDNGGRIYPAKDARMSDTTFRASFPEFQDFSKYVDPKFSSSFYRRIQK